MPWLEDEFVLIVPGCGDPRVVAEIVESILKRLTEPFTINEHVLHIGASAGVAIAPNDGGNVDELIANADLALYRAKSDGAHLRFFLPVLRAQAQARRGLDIELRRAFAENEFDLYHADQARRRGRGRRRGPAALAASGARHPGTGRLHRHARGKRDRTRGQSLDHPNGVREGGVSRCAVNPFPNQAHDARCRATSRPRSPRPGCRLKRSSSRSPNMQPSTTRIRPDRC